MSVKFSERVKIASFFFNVYSIAGINNIDLENSFDLHGLERLQTKSEGKLAIWKSSRLFLWQRFAFFN